MVGLVVMAALILLGTPRTASAQARAASSASGTAGLANADANGDDDDRFDVTTPRRAMEVFLAATRDGDYARAATVLDLRSVKTQERASQGPELARQLRVVMDQKLWLDPQTLSDEPAGNPQDGANTDRVGGLPLGGHDTVPFTMSRMPREDGTLGWMVSRGTVDQIPRLYAAWGYGSLEPLIPGFAKRTYLGDLALWQWGGILAGLPVAVVVGGGVTWAIAALALSLARRTKPKWDDDLVVALKAPTRLGLSVAAARVVVGLLHLPVPSQTVANHVLSLLLIATLAWVAIRLVHFGGDLVEQRAMENEGAPGADQSRLRSLRTQLLVVRRVTDILVLAVAGATMLLQFEVVRSVGVSLLASAGLAGVVLGFAAQKSLGTLLAGIQLSVTQPIRLGDSVHIEGELGTIEEIRLTYVVVRVWDERRLIIPISRFLDQPFQNWTRGSSQLLGTVFLRVDFTLPVEDVREVVERIVKASPKWDGRTQNVQVTEAASQWMELRILVSARDPSSLGDLRVEVREALVAWLRDHRDGAYLPRTRALEGALREGGAVDAAAVDVAKGTGPASREATP